ncbi:MAG: hypothetical protein GY868_17250, partial [Deltaproteobacteria bacterium]|nr:hypothetical protein [Deltaproteobacteria bacterium]
MEFLFQRLGVDDGSRIEHEEQRGIRRSIAEVQWLLVILVVLYYKLPETRVDNELFLLSALCLFSFFVLVTHYLLPR